MTVTCDDVIESLVYDGTSQAIPDEESVTVWKLPTSFTIPSGTQYVGIQCQNTLEGPAGLMVEFENGLTTDGSWECSSDGFDSGMGPAATRPGGNIPGFDSNPMWIWTSNPEDFAAYCQKQIAEPGERSP